MRTDNGELYIVHNIFLNGKDFKLKFYTYLQKFFIHLYIDLHSVRFA
jgi:hypothetical protein